MTRQISLVMTYLRIFPQQTFSTIAYIVIAINICYSIAFVIVTVVQCSPISYAWTRWDGEHEGTCMHINAQVFCAAGFNILLDIIIVVLPMPVLWGMNMGTRKKIMIMTMFAVSQHGDLSMCSCLSNTLCRSDSSLRSSASFDCST